MRGRFGAVWGRFGVAALAVAMGVYLTITPPPGTPTRPTAAYLATDQALDRKLPECRFDEIPLIDVLSFVEQVGAVSIKCDQDALRVDRETPARAKRSTSLLHSIVACAIASTMTAR